jgi:hypothetical protein
MTMVPNQRMVRHEAAHVAVVFAQGSRGSAMLPCYPTAPFRRSERVRRWACAVAKRLNGEGFLVTTYRTDVIKEGVRVWPR